MKSNIVAALSAPTLALPRMRGREFPPPPAKRGAEAGFREATLRAAGAARPCKAATGRVGVGAWLSQLARKLATGTLALCGTLLLASCSSIDPSVYANQKPALDLRQYFNGTLIGHGMFSDRSGEVQRRFVVTIKATWNGDVGTLDEDFVWSDGKTEKRIWTLRPVAGAPGQWTGTADGVIGEARGTVAGNALNWKYDFRLKTDEGKTYDIAFDDWMFLIDERVMLNRAVMSFWGFRVGEVLISFDRRP